MLKLKTYPRNRANRTPISFAPHPLPGLLKTSHLSTILSKTANTILTRWPPSPLTTTYSFFHLGTNHVLTYLRSFICLSQEAYQLF